MAENIGKALCAMTEWEELALCSNNVPKKASPPQGEPTIQAFFGFIVAYQELASSV